MQVGVQSLCWERGLRGCRRLAFHLTSKICSSRAVSLPAQQRVAAILLAGLSLCLGDVCARGVW